MILVFGHRIDLILVLAVVLVALSVLYGMFILVLSRFEPQRSQHRRVKIATVPGHHKVVFVIPCLNEERVLRPSLDPEFSCFGLPGEECELSRGEVDPQSLCEGSQGCGDDCA